MIYKFKMISGRKDGFYREYELYKDNTLYDFHRFIQNELDFDDAQMAAFYTSDANWNKHKQHALFDMGDGAMDSIILEDLIDKNIKHLVYTFDFFNNRSLLIEFIGEFEAERREHYPRTAESKGNPPDQLIDRPVPEPLPIDEVVANNDKKEKTSKKKKSKVEEVEEDIDDDIILDDDDEEDIDDDVLDDGDLDMLSETDDV